MTILSMNNPEQVDHYTGYLEKIEHSEILDFIIPLSLQYPGIENWYRLKVINGVLLGTRKIIL